MRQLLVKLNLLVVMYLSGCASMAKDLSFDKPPEVQPPIGSLDNSTEILLDPTKIFFIVVVFLGYLAIIYKILKEK